jgi:hypothetical protein
MFRPLIALVVMVPLAQAAPEDAVVRIPSHGGSGTVIATSGPDTQHPGGWTLILSCAHLFWQQDSLGRPELSQRFLQKTMTFDAPVPTPETPKQVGSKMLAIGSPSCDVVLIKLNAGPLPYVAPLAPVGFQPGRCWSVGYDEMKLPAQKRPATIVQEDLGGITLTRERPWHGRSGGGLIDARTGYLVGVVSAYEGPSNRAELQRGYHGVYVSHRAILTFLRERGYLRDDRSHFTPQDQSPRPFPPFIPMPPLLERPPRDCPT